MRKSIFALGAVVGISGILFFSLPVPGAPPSDEAVLQNTVGPPDAPLTDFLPDYESSRAAFLQLASELAAIHRGAEMARARIQSEVDDDLTIDWLYLPASAREERLMILASGLHGAEGPVGAAVQRQFMRDYLRSMDLSSTGVLLIHAVNPYGFKYFRRVTENNVDLNRNSDTDAGLYAARNEGYTLIHDLLNPSGPAAAGGVFERLFLLEAIYHIAVHGIGALRQAALQGQYEYPRGIYYGGDDHEPQRAALEGLLLRVTSAYRAVLLVDFHTGYGERGILHLFPSEAPDERIRNATNRVFDGYTIDWAEEGGEFYTVTGDFTVYLGKLLQDGQLYVPMVFEYGTLNSNTTFGAIESIHRTILENQGAHHGYATPEDEAEIKARYRELFYPSSEAWRRKVLNDTAAMWPVIVPRFEALEAP